MIRIYHKNQFDKNFIDVLTEDEEIWNYPIEEIDYLLETHKNESFILIDNRLYEYIL